MMKFDGKGWQIPPPETPWTLDATKQWGQGVENDVVTEIGVVPKPLQQPHPPVFQPFASSERTIRWCAHEGITAILPPMPPEMQQGLYEVYRDEAASVGRDLKPGEGLGVLRDVIITDTDEEAMELWREGPAFCGDTWFAPFGFGDALRPEGREVAYSPEEMKEMGLLFAGTVDSVKQLVQSMLDNSPVDWVFPWQYNGLTPHGKILQTLDRFANQVLPEFSD